MLSSPKSGLHSSLCCSWPSTNSRQNWPRASHKSLNHCNSPCSAEEVSGNYSTHFLLYKVPKLGTSYPSISTTYSRTLMITNEPSNLTTLCVACHAVLHIGYNLINEIIEIWESDLSQVEIIQHTRKEIANGKSLAQIKKA